jgi:hypothetical protein
MPTIDAPQTAFLSYATEDTAIVKAVVRQLREVYIEAWIDREGLTAGTPDWEIAH